MIEINIYYNIENNAFSYIRCLTLIDVTDFSESLFML